MGSWCVLLRQCWIKDDHSHNPLTGKVFNQTHFCNILIALAIHSDYILTTFRWFWLHSDIVLTTIWLHLNDSILITFWLHSDYILTTFWLYSKYNLTTFWLQSDSFWLNSAYVLVVITNFWSLVLDDHWSKKIYRSQMTFLITCAIFI